ncbi:hypothetical protein D3C84_1151330 [compost metagenome]
MKNRFANVAIWFFSGSWGPGASSGMTLRKRPAIASDIKAKIQKAPRQPNASPSTVTSGRPNSRAAVTPIYT